MEDQVSDTTPTPPSGEEESAVEDRAELSTSTINDLPDSAFAYFEPGGAKDDEGKTTPRSNRHFPIHDAAHVRNALARAPQSPFGDKAMPKIKAAAKKFGIEVEGDAESKSAPSADITRHRKPRHRAVPLGPEVRMFKADEGQGLEIREADREGNLVTIRGALLVYNQPYSVHDALGNFEERMAPGVATGVLSGDTRYLYNHKGMVLARSAAGTLTFDDTPRALWTNATVDIRNTDANNLVVAVERGDVSQMSVGFLCGEDEWNEDFTQRTVRRFAAMPDASAVSFPCSPTTSLEIAQRMATDIPVESRARVRRLYIGLQAANLRAGKVLSGQNADQIAQATKLLHGVLSSGGVDPASLVDNDSIVDDDQDGSSVGDGDDGGSTAVDPDGSGERQVPTTATERRAASLSFGDQQSAVYEALCEHLGGAGVDVDIWICDCASDWVVWEAFYGDSGQWRIAYTVDADGTVTFDGTPEQVVSETSWQPVAEGLEADTETPTRVSRALWIRAEARNLGVL